MSDTQTNNPTINWEIGTAYELFISLHVLHAPEKFALRASWAAGIRSRIPAPERKLLEDVIPFIGLPLAWIHDLTGSKDAISALWSLKQMPPAKRLPHMLCLKEDSKHEWEQMLLRVCQCEAWEQSDMESVKGMNKKDGKSEFDEEKFTRFLDRWAKPNELGEGFLSALQSYHQAFFEDEEKRVEPILKAGLERARQLSTKMSVEELMVELSQGVRLEKEYSAKNFTIIPAYWTTPLILFEPTCNGNSMLFFFGARPADMAAIPGEMVPDSLLRVMKALADPTRLKILYYLTQEELSPSELARRLRLRAPTVTHHLNELRLSGLVNVTFRGAEKLYRTREESLDAMCDNLKGFLHNPQEE